MNITVPPAVALDRQGILFFALSYSKRRTRAEGAEEKI
jgi:hypothetical protein